MKCFIVQNNITNTDYVSILNRISGEYPDLVCFGELSATGCLYRPQPIDVLDDILQTLADYDFAIMLGCPIKTDKGLFNSYLYYAKGSYQSYNKINLFEPMNETTVYQPGTDPGIFETEWGKIGVAICYDLRFPELFRSIKSLGVTRVFVPAAFPRVRINDWKRLLVEHAIENHITMVGINAVGHDGVNEFGGCSMVVDQSGKILAQADETGEIILKVEI